MRGLLDDIVLLMTKKPQGMKARELALSLGKSRKEINQLLYANKARFVVDENYCWRLKNTTKVARIDKEDALWELKNFYKVGYFEIKALQELNGEMFENAVENAKELSDFEYYFSLSEWTGLVLRDRDGFKRAFEQFKEKINNERKKYAEEIEEARLKREEEITRVKNLCSKCSLETITLAVKASQPNNFVSSVVEECLRFDVPDWKIQKIIKDKLSCEDIRKSAMLILYYKENYPDLNVSLVENIDKTPEEIKKLITPLLPKQTERMVCVGDCSSCRRDVCVMDENDYQENNKR